MGHMGVVLPTMQPDQYHLVSWPADQPLIVQGQPGALERPSSPRIGLCLTSREREGRPESRIAIIGP